MIYAILLLASLLGAGHAVAAQLPTITWEACHGVTFSLPDTWVADQEARPEGCTVYLYPKSWSHTRRRARVELLDYVFVLYIEPRSPDTLARARGCEVSPDVWVCDREDFDSRTLSVVRKHGWYGVTQELRGVNRVYKDGGGNAGVVFFRAATIGTTQVSVRILESEPYYYPHIFQVLLQSMRFPKATP